MDVADLQKCIGLRVVTDSQSRWRVVVVADLQGGGRKMLSGGRTIDQVGPYIVNHRGRDANNRAICR